MLSSKDVLERTGISRATLNNYIAAGLVARPDVLPPGPADGDAPRLGYFPDDTVERIETIQRLKREGWSLGRIVEYFAKGGDDAAPVPAAAPASAERPAAAWSPAPPAASAVPASVPTTAAPAVSALPQALPLAVLLVTLNDPESLWVGLPVHDYFTLVSEVEARVRAVVARFGGQAVRIAPYRFVCHFLPVAGEGHMGNALRAARDIAAAIQELGAARNSRRPTAVDIVANSAIVAGEAWVGASAGGDLQVVGDVVALAQHVGSAARPGTILMTRDLVGRLPAAMREGVVYGIPDRSSPSIRHLMTFARLRDIGGSPAIPRRVADLPVTEFVALHDDAPAAKKEPA